MDPLVFGGDRLASRGTYWLQLLGRLKPGVAPGQAQAEMNLLMRQIVEQYPDSHKGPNEITLDKLWRSPFGANVYLYATLPMLMAIAGVVLLLACANVANLLLVRSIARRREIAGTFVGAFGMLALVLASIGIYGVIAYTTRQRTREIGIRVSLGARKSDVFRMVLNQGLQLTLIGLSIGIAVSLALTRFLRSMLFGVTDMDALTFAAVSVLLCLVALAACSIPEWRAAKVDPTVALRYE